MSDSDLSSNTKSSARGAAPANGGQRNATPLRQTLHRLTTLSLVGLVVGLTTAFATAGFVELFNHLNDLLFISPASRSNLSAAEIAVATVAVLTCGGLVVGLILQFAVEQRTPHGPADTIFAVQLHERLPHPVSGLMSTLAAALSLGCGASVGLYGPLVYLGTLVGQLGNRLPLGLPNIRNITIACGVAAAISTAFNAPLAALIFTHEVILRHYSLRMFTAVTVASSCGYFVANVVFNNPPLFLSVYHGSFRAGEFLLFAIEGLGCGAIAVLYMKSLHFSTALAERVNIPFALKPMLAGFLVSLVAIQIPEVLGAGQQVLRDTIPGLSHGAATLLLILVAKFLVTVTCIGFGFPGGVISPTLLIGALFGALFAELVPATLLDSYSAMSVYAVCGMLAVMSPVIGAPMTALLLVFELTRSYEVTIAAMLAIVFANLLASCWYGRSLYDQQLANRGIDLSLGRERAYLMHHKVVEHLTQTLPVVTQSASFAEVREQMAAKQARSIVVVDDRHRYQGILLQQQLDGLQDNDDISIIELLPTPQFDDDTSLWEAMQIMRAHLGEAIAVVDRDSGRYLGVIPETAVVDAYLDAAEKLRREEHEI
jgi:CIC family chloride channel protein